MALPPMEFGVIELLVSLLGASGLAYKSAQHRGLIGIPTDPVMVKTLKEATVALGAISETLAVDHDILSKLDRQHGDEASEGEYESWKLSPLDRRHMEAAHKKAHCALVNSAVILRMLLAGDDTNERKEHFGEARAALAAGDSVRSEYT